MEGSEAELTGHTASGGENDQTRPVVLDQLPHYVSPYTCPCRRVQLWAGGKDELNEKESSIVGYDMRSMRPFLLMQIFSRIVLLPYR